MPRSWLIDPQQGQVWALDRPKPTIHAPTPNVSKPRVAAAAERCEAPAAKPDFYTQSPHKGRCAGSVYLGPANAGSALETYEFSAEQENGWTVYELHVRPRGARSPASWQRFDAGTSLPEPSLAIADARFGQRILWTREEGLGGPGNIRLRLSRVRPDGSLELGTSVEAGGQPCD